MAQLEVSKLSLIELANRTNNGDLMTVSEVLSESNEVLMDAVWVPANKLTSHVHTRRISLPTGTWRIVNQGASEEASRTRPVEEGIGILEAYSTIDELLIELAEDKKKFISTEDLAFVEGLGQTFMTAMVYGNIATNPEQFNGWATRLNALGTYVISAGGSGGDTSSIFAIQWGENKVHCIFKPDMERPSQNHPVQIDDLGYQTVTDSSSNPYQAHRTRFRIYAGLAIHDDRNIGRVANIETAGATNIFDKDDLINLLNQMENRGKGAFLYCNKTIMSQVDIAGADLSNVYYTSQQLWGNPVTAFRGHPFRLMEAILDTEAQVS